MIPTIVVTGDGEAPIGPTLALNLAVAFSALGCAVELCDEESPALASAPLRDARISGGDAADGERCVLLRPGARLGLPVADSSATASPARLRIVSCAVDRAVSDPWLRRPVRVVVPVDASQRSRRALDAIASLLDAPAGDWPGPPPTLTVILSRLLPRGADRWALVEGLEDRFAQRVCDVTLPMGRARGPARPASGATLYAPTGGAARAYRAVARLLAGGLGVALRDSKVGRAGAASSASDA